MTPKIYIRNTPGTKSLTVFYKYDPDKGPMGCIFVHEDGVLTSQGWIPLTIFKSVTCNTFFERLELKREATEEEISKYFPSLN